MDTANAELVQTWLKDLDPKSSKWYRLNAVHKLGALKFSDPQVIEALMIVKERDRDPEVRAAAEVALLALANQPGPDAHTPREIKVLAEPDNFNLNLQNKTGDDLLREQIKLLLAINTNLVELRKAQSAPTNGVTVNDIKMSLGSMIEFMLKWAIAVIPVAIIIGIIWFIITAILLLQ